MITQTINLNMVPGAVCPVIHVNQYDNDSGALIFKLYNNGSAFSITSGSAVVINGTKPDGYGFSYSASYSGNTVTANVTQQMTAVSGEVKCELRITKGTNTVGTQNFTLMVEPAALDENTVVSDSDIPAIAAAADYAAQAAAVVSSLNWGTATLTVGANVTDNYSVVKYIEALKLCVCSFSLSFTNTTYDSGSVVVSGLPKPGANVFGTLGFGTSSTSTMRVRVDTNGQLVMHGSMTPLAQIYNGQFAYSYTTLT